MRLVTRVTGSLGVGLMSILELLGQTSMAGKAGFRKALVEQPCLIRGMGIVATQAFPLSNRFMLKPCAMFFRCLAVTGITQIFHLLLKHSTEFRYMWTVARQAISIYGRFVVHPFFELPLFMAGKTVHCSHGLALFY
jgi:hypothetical protein